MTKQRWHKAVNITLTLTLVVTLVLSTTPALAGGNVSITRTFQPSSADSWISQLNPTINYNSNTFLDVKSETIKMFRGLVQFDIASIPTGSTVSSATLSLYLSSTNATSSQTHNVHQITETWTEAGVTWNSMNANEDWNTPGGTYNSTATDSRTVTTTLEYKPWTVTTNVSSFVAGSAFNYGWLVKDSEIVSNITEWKYNSNASVSNRPTLSVTFTAPWDSYTTALRTVVTDTYASPSTTVYMKGTGFPNISYLIAYYDNGGTKRGSEIVSALGGVLNSAYLLTYDKTAAAGTWHALVQPSLGYTGFGTANYATIVASPDTYGLVANDSFTVESSAIPEFPTVIAGIAVAGLCAVIYWWLRRRRVAYVKA